MYNYINMYTIYIKLEILLNIYYYFLRILIIIEFILIVLIQSLLYK